MIALVLPVSIVRSGISTITGSVRWLTGTIHSLVSQPPRLRRRRIQRLPARLRRFTSSLRTYSDRLKTRAVKVLSLPVSVLKLFQREEPTLAVHKLVYRLRLFTNACGDFTLMSREDWFALRAYPELELFSLHIDSLMLYIAHYGGVQERTLPPSMVTYHIEHKGGWTPESARDGSLDKRLREKKLDQLTMDKLYDYVWTMEQQRRPIDFNHESWGLAKAELAEVELKHAAPWPVN